MKRRATTRALGRALLLATSLALGGSLGCKSEDQGHRSAATDTKTNWLQSCDSDAECGTELACLCGLCSVVCDDDDACDAAGSGATCLKAECSNTPRMCRPVVDAASSNRVGDGGLGDDDPDDESSAFDGSTDEMLDDVGDDPSVDGGADVSTGNGGQPASSPDLATDASVLPNSACDSSSLEAECCWSDADCDADARCYGADCPGDAPGRCAAPAGDGCFDASDCAADQVCEGARVTACGAQAEPSRGVCTSIIQEGSGGDELLCTLGELSACCAFPYGDNFLDSTATEAVCAAQTFGRGDYSPESGCSLTCTGTQTLVDLAPNAEELRLGCLECGAATTNCTSVPLADCAAAGCSERFAESVSTGSMELFACVPPTSTCADDQICSIDEQGTCWRLSSNCQPSSAYLISCDAPEVAEACSGDSPTASCLGFEQTGCDDADCCPGLECCSGGSFPGGECRTSCPALD